jgi:hypothetical protein
LNKLDASFEIIRLQFKSESRKETRY